MLLPSAIKRKTRIKDLRAKVRSHVFMYLPWDILRIILALLDNPSLIQLELALPVPFLWISTDRPLQVQFLHRLPVQLGSLKPGYAQRLFRPQDDAIIVGVTGQIGVCMPGSPTRHC